MRYFVLPFALSIPLATPLLWYHLDGLDPVDISVQMPSQEEIDFADTRERLDELQPSLYEPPVRHALHEDRFTGPGSLVRTVESSPPGY